MSNLFDGMKVAEGTSPAENAVEEEKLSLPKNEPSSANDVETAEENVVSNGNNETMAVVSTDNIKKTDEEKPENTKVPESIPDSGVPDLQDEKKIEKNSSNSDDNSNINSSEEKEPTSADEGVKDTKKISSSASSASGSVEANVIPPKSQPPAQVFKKLPPKTQTTTMEAPNFCTDHELTKTPVLNPDALFRILSKFTEKAAANIPRSATNPNSSIFSRLFGSSTFSLDGDSPRDPCLKAFSLLLSSLEEEEYSPRQSLSAFVHLVSTWAHSRTHLELASPTEMGNGKSAKNSFSNWITAHLLYLSIDTAQSLVAHGCLDNFYIILPSQNEPIRAINILTESVFLSELSDEKTELAALKFFLTTGCRVMEGWPITNGSANAESKTDSNMDKSKAGEAMLRGTHLLQTIRVCYHVFLKTGSPSNKTTARATLQQVVSSVFVRMGRTNSAANPPLSTNGLKNSSSTAVANNSEVNASILGEGKNSDEQTNNTGITFQSEDERDAFLVLRSLCKLSMKTISDGRQSKSSSRHLSSPKQAEGGTWNSKENGHEEIKTKTGVPNPTDMTQNAKDENLNSTPVPESPSSKPKSLKPRMKSTSNMAMMTDPLTSSIVASPLSHNPALESKILALELILQVLSLDYEASNQKNQFSSSKAFQFAIQNYLCASLLKNSTSNLTQVVGLSLRIFVPLIRLFRSHLKTEIEVFVTNVFFVLLDSPNSTIEHKSLVVTLFEEICSDPETLAEIFLNYDCDLSAVDLFHRIVNALGKVAKVDEYNPTNGTELAPSEVEALVGSVEKRKTSLRQAIRDLRLDAMRALRQVLASLHASIVIPLGSHAEENSKSNILRTSESLDMDQSKDEEKTQTSLVQMYDSKKKFKEEQLDVILRFNRSPAKGIAYAGECGHLDSSDPVEVAKYLLKNGNDASKMDKTQIGEYLGKEAEYQNGFCIEVLQEYTNLLDFAKMDFDEAIRYFLSGFRLPGEAQKIDRIMERFAERFCLQNPSIFPTADAAFILAFAVIMLNTDLHNPAIKEERRMTKDAFLRMNRGICEGEDLPDELLLSIFDRIKTNPISLKEDDEARERAGVSSNGNTSGTPGLSPAVFFGNHYDEMERARESNYLKERDQMLRTTESLFKRKRRVKKKKSSRLSNTVHDKFVRTQDTGLRDDYVSPMFEVAWGVCLAVFSTSLENANGTASVSAMAKFSEEEMDMALDSAMETTEVCLTAFRLAICTAGLCGNETARAAFVHALFNFTLLGTGKLMEHRHVRCVQALLRLGQEDGELLGDTWEHVFFSLSEVTKMNQLFEVLAKNERVELEKELRIRKDMLGEELSETSEDDDDDIDDDGDDDSLIDIEMKDMDRRSIDEANARAIHEAVPETYIDGIYQRSSSLSPSSVKDFILQLCRVSRMEISGYGGHVGSHANKVDLDNSLDRNQRNHQPVIYSLEKLVEVAHYNMDSRPRLIFADLWTDIAGHLTSTALHSNPAVAMYAVDSFRQLSTHYLQKEELGVFEFQKRFLKPFETVMIRSEYVITKELLLNCIQQIILRFGTHKIKQRGGMLRSGWRPVLTVLGLTGHDSDDGIAQAGFDMLNEQLDHCLQARDSLQKTTNDTENASSSISLVTEHFVTLVDALVIFVSGNRINMSLQAIDHLVELSTLIADGAIPLPNVRKKSTKPVPKGNSFEEKVENDVGHSDENIERPLELQLWWPILLGLSQSIGDKRRAVREKSLKCLFDLINTFFLTITKNEDMANGVVTEEAKDYHLQTLQLIFRGILIPTLEFAETDMDAESPHPQGFPNFITKASPQKSVSNEPIGPYEDLHVNDDDMNENSWIFTTFGPLLDGCITICLEAMKIYKSDTLIEEVLAVINSCLLSDSGALAVTGLRRLQKLITVDLSTDSISDDTWAVVCHMLRRCLSVRGLASVMEAFERQNSLNEESVVSNEDQALVNEFILEEKLYSGRRYIGCNATMIIGTLLCNSKYVACIGKRWSLFLMKGLATSIEDWENAAKIVGVKIENPVGDQGEISSPPHYLENALYGRQWMTKLVLSLIDEENTDTEESESPLSKLRLTLIQEQTRNLFTVFIEKESNLDGLVSSSPEDLMIGASRAREVAYITKLVSELLDAYVNFDGHKLSKLAWLCPMLSTLIQSNNKAVRVSVQLLVSRMFEGPLSPKAQSD